jgi:hypothetical protein
MYCITVNLLCQFFLRWEHADDAALEELETAQAPEEATEVFRWWFIRTGTRA